MMICRVVLPTLCALAFGGAVTGGNEIVITSDVFVTKSIDAVRLLKEITVEIDLCKENMNYFFQYDLSGSLGKNIIKKNKKFNKFVKKQVEYTAALTELMDANGLFNNEKYPNQFGLSAYTRRTGDLIELSSTVEANDIYDMLTPNGFIGKWDRNSFNSLTKKNNRYTHMGDVFLTNVMNQLFKLQKKETNTKNNEVSVNTTIILFTDGHPEYFQFRKIRNKVSEFRKSLVIAENAANTLRLGFEKTGVYVHCVLVQNDAITKRFINEQKKICDSIQLAKDGKVEIEDQVDSTFRFKECIEAPKPTPSPVLQNPPKPTAKPTKWPEPTAKPTAY